MACLLAFFPGSPSLSVAAPRPEFFSLNFHNQDMSKQHFAGGPLLCSLVASLHLSFPKERQREIKTTWVEKANSSVVGPREGGDERGRGRAEAAATPAVPPRAPRTRAAAGESEEQRASSGAGEREGNRAQSSRPPGSAAAAPTARQQSVRLLLQLPAVEGLRGKIAWRREGRGGTKAARSQPGEVGRNKGVL